MKILITGGTGFVGQRVLKELDRRGHSCIVLTRNPKRAKSHESTGATFFRWDGEFEEIPKEVFKDIDGVINLMGENIADKRWSDSQKKKLQNSRIRATQTLVSGIEENCTKPLKFFISASAIGYYPVEKNNQNKNPFNEDSSKGSGFLSDLCEQWEKATEGLTKTQRKIIMRSGVILGPEAGALNKLLPLFKIGAGGPIGNGKMMMSWISVVDMVRAICEFAENDLYQGIYNLVAPNPVSNKTFTAALAKAVNRPALFPAPPFALKLAFGEMSSVILDSQEVHPKRLLEAGFKFQHPEIFQALNDLVSPRKERINSKGEVQAF